MPDECGSCGAFGPWRRAGHADWCPKNRAQQIEQTGAGCVVGSMPSRARPPRPAVEVDAARDGLLVPAS